MTRSQIVNVFGVSGSLIVLALVGGAMLHKQVAPAISADAIRPHGERGPCINCHEVLQTNPRPSRPNAVDGAIGPGAGGQFQTANTQWAAPSQFANGGSALPPVPAASPALRFAAVSRLGAANGAAVAAMGRPQQAMLGGRGEQFAPAIVAGTPAPHGWRGECGECHPMIRPTLRGAPPPANPQTHAFNPGCVGQPQPPCPPGPTAAQPLVQPIAMGMNPAPQRLEPQEAEALGMSVRATRGAGNVQGVLVVETEGLARRSGIMLGDIVRAVDGRITPTLNMFTSVTRGVDPVRGVVLDVVRAGQPQVLVLR